MDYLELLRILWWACYPVALITILYIFGLIIEPDPTNWHIMSTRGFHAKPTRGEYFRIEIYHFETRLSFLNWAIVRRTS